MSVGGDGIVDREVFVEVSQPAPQPLSFVPRRFGIGGGLDVRDSERIKNTDLRTCVLCGGVILDEDWNLEHPLPQWLHRLAGDVGERKATSFRSTSTQPTWRQLSLRSHKSCNTEFAKTLETPVISSVTAMVSGGRVTWQELDRMFDWFDKVKIASAHMGVALRGHDVLMNYGEHSFPNVRTGLFDRLAIIFRMDKGAGLDLMNCLDEGFLSTPSAIFLRIKDLVIVYASNNFILSTTFGLGEGRLEGDGPEFHPGSGLFAAGFGSRVTRIAAAKIFAQPMRRRLQKEGVFEQSRALQPNGDGWVFELIGSRWYKLKSSSFDSLTRIAHPIGVGLAALETLEWVLLSKEQDFARYGIDKSFHMASVPQLLRDRSTLINMIGGLRGGLKPAASDRP